MPIFQKEPFITFQELQAKYGDILTDQQIYRGLLGTFAPYVSERREEAFQEQLLQAKQAALQLEILSHPVGGSLTMPETEVRSLARASFNSMLDGMPAGMACYITCAVNAMYAGDVSGLKNEPLSERMLLSSANQGPLENTVCRRIPSSAICPSYCRRRKTRYTLARAPEKRVHHRDDGFPENLRVGQRRQPDEL